MSHAKKLWACASGVKKVLGMDDKPLANEHALRLSKSPNDLTDMSVDK